MRHELSSLQRMSVCTLWVLQDVYGHCEGRIEWHHVFQYAGQQINEAWAIVGACHKHHEMVKSDRAIRMAFETASLKLASNEELAAYPRKKWDEIKRTLGI